MWSFIRYLEKYCVKFTLLKDIRSAWNLISSCSFTSLSPFINFQSETISQSIYLLCLLKHTFIHNEATKIVKKLLKQNIIDIIKYLTLISAVI